MIKEVHKVKLGGVIVRLRNNAGVDNGFLDQILSKSELDKRELLLIIDTKEGSKCEKDGLAAVTIPSVDLINKSDSQAIHNAGKNITIYQDIDSYRRDILQIDLIQSQEWDAVVYIPKKTTEKWKDFKPYFAFVLGHELEHVKIIRENLKFHFCATWLYKFNVNIFKESGTDSNSLKKCKFPLELHCNKQGKKLAINLFNKTKFDDCLIVLKQKKDEEFRNLLDFLLNLDDEPYRDNIWESICRDIRNYYDGKNQQAHGQCAGQDTSPHQEKPNKYRQPQDPVYDRGYPGQVGNVDLDKPVQPGIFSVFLQVDGRRHPDRDREPGRQRDQPDRPVDRRLDPGSLRKSRRKTGQELPIDPLKPLARDVV